MRQKMSVMLQSDAQVLEGCSELLLCVIAEESHEAHTLQNSGHAKVQAAQANSPPPFCFLIIVHIIAQSVSFLWSISFSS